MGFGGRGSIKAGYFSFYFCNSNTFKLWVKHETDYLIQTCQLKYPRAKLWSNFSFLFKNVKEREGIQNSLLPAALLWSQCYLSFYVSQRSSSNIPICFYYYQLKKLRNSDFCNWHQVDTPTHLAWPSQVYSLTRRFYWRAIKPVGRDKSQI